eukprot:UN11668
MPGFRDFSQHLRMAIFKVSKCMVYPTLKSNAEEMSARSAYRDRLFKICDSKQCL